MHTPHFFGFLKGGNMSLKSAFTTFVLVVISLAVINRVSFLKTVTG